MRTNARTALPGMLPLALACQLAWTPDARATTAADPDMPASFNDQMLISRGIDPALANSLLAGQQFGAGHHRVALKVNGKTRGQVTIRVDENDRLCFDANLMRAAQLRLPSSHDHKPAGCGGFLAAYPETQVDMDASSLSIALLVPSDAVLKEAAGEDWARGGHAAIFNYQANALRTNSRTHSNTSASLNSELGFNAGDWVVRSRRIDSINGGKRSHGTLDTYVQRTFASTRMTAQAGDVNLRNPVVPAARVRGVQIATESALQVAPEGVLVEGIAQSPARVEIRQNGTLFYSTVVPVGPFRLRDVQPPQRNADLDVTIIESQGGEHRFTIPSATFTLAPPPSGFTFGAGKVTNSWHDRRNTWMASAGWTGHVSSRTVASVGAVATNKYTQGLGAQLNFSAPWPGASVSVQAQGSNAAREHVRGAQAQLSINQSLEDGWSIYASQTQQTPGYRTPLETNLDPGSRYSRYRRQVTGGLSVTLGRLGNVSAGLTDISLQDGEHSRRINASWNARVGRITLSASADWGRDRNNRSDKNVYLSANIPLGENQDVRLSVRERARESLTSVNYTARVDDALSLRASAERNTRSQTTNAMVGASATTRVSQFDVSASRDTNSQSTLTGLARGGIVLHAGGITTSPYPISDTFALLRVGSQSGIRVRSPSGPLWTDRAGRAVIPSVTPFGSSQVEVDTSSLPSHSELDNGSAQLRLGRGAVEHIDFRLRSARRLLLAAVDEHGTPLLADGAVADDGGQLQSLVQAQGRIFLSDYQAGLPLWVSRPDGTRCRLQFTVPREQDYSVPFEKASATCITEETSSP